MNFGGHLKKNPLPSGFNTALEWKNYEMEQEMWKDLWPEHFDMDSRPRFVIGML